MFRRAQTNISTPWFSPLDELAIGPVYAHSVSTYVQNEHSKNKICCWCEVWTWTTKIQLNFRQYASTKCKLLHIWEYSQHITKLTGTSYSYAWCWHFCLTSCQQLPPNFPSSSLIKGQQYSAMVNTHVKSERETGYGTMETIVTPRHIPLLNWHLYVSAQLSGILMLSTSGGGRSVQTISLVFPK
jgi:hypothetical protein